MRVKLATILFSLVIAASTGCKKKDSQAKAITIAPPPQQQVGTEPAPAAPAATVPSADAGTAPSPKATRTAVNVAPPPPAVAPASAAPVVEPPKQYPGPGNAPKLMKPR